MPIGHPLDVIERVRVSAPLDPAPKGAAAGELDLVDAATGRKLGSVPLVLAAPFEPVPKPIPWPRLAASAAAVILMAALALAWRR